MPDVILDHLVVHFIQTNCYVFGDAATREVVIIDPGDVWTTRRDQRVDDYVRERDYRPVAILLTHGHPDHGGGAVILKRKLGVPVWFHPAAADLVGSPPARALREGDTVAVGRHALHVIETPGHSPGGVVYFEPALEILFCGDTLFYRSIGRTDLAGGDHAQLMRSIREKIMANPAIPDATRLYPGHMRPTTKGFEAAHNMFRGQWRA